MDPVTLVTISLLSGFFFLNRLAAFSANKRKAGGQPAGQSNGPLEKRVGSRGAGQPRNDAGGEAHFVPEQHLRMNAQEPPAAAQAEPPADQSGVAVLQMIRDNKTGRFSKRATAA